MFSKLPTADFGDRKKACPSGVKPAAADRVRGSNGAYAAMSDFRSILWMCSMVLAMRRHTI